MAKLEIQLNFGENDYDPRVFVDATVYAEDMGFRTAWFGDHIFPWFHSGKRSSFVWSTMASALEGTQRIRVGPLVTVPIGARYHPAIVAQAAATLDNTYPGRVLLGVGTGEALNEIPFWNGKWPKWAERAERLIEGIKLMRMLWESKKPFKFEGKYFAADFYYLYTKPKRRIPIYFSAVGRRAAHFAGMHGDNLVTITPRNNVQTLEEKIIPAFRRGEKHAGKKRRGEVVAEFSFSFRKPEEIVRKSWRTLGIMRKDSWSIPNPVAVEEEGRRVTVDDVRRNLHLCRNWNDLTKMIEAYEKVGARAVALVTGPSKKLIREIAENVLSVF